MMKWFFVLVMSSVLCTSQVYSAGTDSKYIDSTIEFIEQKRQEERQKKDRELQEKIQAKKLKDEAKKLKKRKKEIHRDLHNRDAKLYKKIQKLAKQLYYPFLNQAKSRGGQVRFNKAIVYLSKLVRIHEDEEYGSEQKIKLLFEVISDMKIDLKKLRETKKIKNDIAIDFTEEEQNQVRGDVQILFQRTPEKKSKTMGGNMGLSFFVGGGVGASCGCTKTNLGERKLTVLGQLYGEMGVLVGPSVKAGYYESKVGEGSFLAGKFEGGTGGLVLGGSVLSKDLYDFEKDKHQDTIAIEVGLGLLGGLKGILFAGCEICPLPTDWKKQRKTMGLTMREDNFPAWLEGDNIEDIQSSYSCHIEENKELMKKYSKEKYSQEKKNDVELELEEEDE